MLYVLSAHQLQGASTNDVVTAGWPAVHTHTLCVSARIHACTHRDDVLFVNQLHGVDINDVLQLDRVMLLGSKTQVQKCETWL